MATADSWVGAGGGINSFSPRLSHIVVSIPVVVMEAGSNVDTHYVGIMLAALDLKEANIGWCIKINLNTGCLHRLLHL